VLHEVSQVLEHHGARPLAEVEPEHRVARQLEGSLDELDIIGDGEPCSRSFELLLRDA
jgi:hypothetical protein